MLFTCRVVCSFFFCCLYSYEIKSITKWICGYGCSHRIWHFLDGRSYRRATLANDSTRILGFSRWWGKWRWNFCGEKSRSSADRRKTKEFIKINWRCSLRMTTRDWLSILTIYVEEIRHEPKRKIVWLEGLVRILEIQFARECFWRTVVFPTGTSGVDFCDRCDLCEAIWRILRGTGRKVCRTGECV